MNNSCRLWVRFPPGDGHFPNFNLEINKISKSRVPGKSFKPKSASDFCA